MPLIFYFLFYRLVLRRVHFLYSNCAEGCLVVWTWGSLDSGNLLVWSCYDVIVIMVNVKVSKGIMSFSPMGSTVWTLDIRPMGRFAWSNHIYFQITQTGSTRVVPLHLCTNKGGIVDISTMPPLYEYLIARLPGTSLKVHKHEIILIFFLPNSNPYMLAIWLLFLRFHCPNISTVIEQTRNQIFLMSNPKFFFFKILTWSYWMGS